MFRLDVCGDNGWRRVPIPDYVLFEGLALNLPQHGYVELSLNIYDGIFGQLPPGQYRIVRNVGLPASPVTEDITVSAKFTISSNTEAARDYQAEQALV